MKKHSMLLTAAFGISTLLAGYALADTAPSTIDALPKQGKVAVSGTVEEIKNPGKFILRDQTGSIKVELPTQETATLQEGEQVTVTGEVKRGFMGLMGKEIMASSIDVHKGLAGTLSENTTTSADAAEPVSISKMPPKGMVELGGKIASIHGKIFKLQDDTGKVSVTAPTGQAAKLHTGDEVTVIGYVNRSLLNKSVKATQVIVVPNAADAEPAAGE